MISSVLLQLRFSSLNVKCAIKVHIIQKAQVTLNKIVHKKRNHYLAHVSMPHGEFRFIAIVKP